jgi:phosphatidylinositol alpha-1,6-mannosyltransferase
VLWITNDLPPRAGGIEVFIGHLLQRVHPTTSVVLGPPGGEDAMTHDAAQPYRIVRVPGRVLPTSAIRQRAVGLARQHDVQVIVLGAMWPLGELAPALQERVGVPIVALSHGLEAGLARAGGGRLIRRASRGLAVVTTISDWSESRLAPHVRADRIARVAPGVDVDAYKPDRAARADQRHVWGVPDDAAVVGCVSRLVPRKGQDTLVRCWPEVRSRHPEAWLVLVGEGPMDDALRRAVTEQGRDAQIVLAGRAEARALPAAYAAMDLFAMPCRDRWAGADVEGLGIVYLEAQAAGLPVVAGRSGGAPETVLDGRTGSIVDGRDDKAVAAAIDRWLADPEGRMRAGAMGREWVTDRWSWSATADAFTSVLDTVIADRH